MKVEFLLINSDDMGHLFNLILVQERLTKQIAITLCEAISPAGVAVVIEAT